MIDLHPINVKNDFIMTIFLAFNTLFKTSDNTNKSIHCVFFMNQCSIVLSVDHLDLFIKKSTGVSKVLFASC